jgi:hypothetical protein
LFDERFWTVRYMVADTGKWLPGRRVLISPMVIGRPETNKNLLHVDLTREEVVDSPTLDTDQPVSRRYEKQLFDHHGWPYYWGGSSLWGLYAEPGALLHSDPLDDPEKPEDNPETEDPERTNLRSTEEVTGYKIEAKDGEIGHVEDFFVDDQSWVLRLLLVDTRNWLPGKKVIVSPRWARSIDWAGSSLEVDLTKEQVRKSPEYDPSRTIHPDDEKRLSTYYGLPLE